MRCAPASRGWRRRWSTTTRRAATRLIAASIRKPGSRKIPANNAIRGTASGHFSIGTWTLSMPTCTRRRNSALLAALLVALLSPAVAHAQDVPRVRLVATGGEIFNPTGGRPSAQEPVLSLPGIERFAQPGVEEVF